jgi:hypothetical protein
MPEMKLPIFFLVVLITGALKMVAANETGAGIPRRMAGNGGQH